LVLKQEIPALCRDSLYINSLVWLLQSIPGFTFKVKIKVKISVCFAIVHEVKLSTVNYHPNIFFNPVT